MRIKIKPMIIMFFIFYIFAWSLTTCSFVKADEPEITCEAFIKEEICKMTPEEQEKWFWELFQSLIEQRIIEDKEVEGMEICLKETEEGKLIPCEGVDV